VGCLVGGFVLGGLEGRTDLSVNLLELVFDPCELLIGDHGDLFTLVGHFGCVMWVVRRCCVWVCGLETWSKKKLVKVRLLKKSQEEF
jgi:hypothetical protein